MVLEEMNVARVKRNRSSEGNTQCRRQLVRTSLLASRGGNQLFWETERGELEVRLLPGGLSTGPELKNAFGINVEGDKNRYRLQKVRSCLQLKS